MSGPTVEAIQQVVSAYRGVPLREMINTSRRRHFTHPRQEAVFLCRELRKVSYPTLARIFKSKEHTTQIHSVCAVKARCAESSDYALDLWAMREWLRQPDYGRAEALELWACRSIAAGLAALGRRSRGFRHG